MGVVWEAVLEGPEGFRRPVALKLLSRLRFASDRERTRFEDEARIACRLDHPGIVPVLDIGEVDGQPYYTMALVEGGNLEQRLDRAVQFAQAHPGALEVFADGRHDADDIAAGRIEAPTDGAELSKELISIIDQAESYSEAILREAEFALERLTGHRFGRKPDRWKAWLATAKAPFHPRVKEFNRKENRREAV